MQTEPTIALMDCDSFFVSCERLFNPKLIEKPVCVLSNNDGCVVSRSKEAKKIGVKMGMPYFMAKKEFPNVIYISSHMDLYIEISNRIMALLADISPNFEQYSIDEAFIDLSGLGNLYKKNYIEIGNFIKKEIWDKIGIPVSVGISTSKTLAKLAASKAKKLDGTYLIEPENIKSELNNLPLSEIWGIGKNTANLMSRYGINFTDEFVNLPDQWLKGKMGIRGIELKQELLGLSTSPIQNVPNLPKSIQNTRSFPEFSTDKNYIKKTINAHIHTACRRLRKYGLKCGGVKLILKTKDFNYFVEKIALKDSTDWNVDIINATTQVFERMFLEGVIYRSSGIVLEKLSQQTDSQLTFFNNPKDDEKRKNLGHCVDNITLKHGKNLIKVGFC